MSIEPEQTYWEEQSADDGVRREFLWLELTLVVTLGLLEVIQVREGGHDDERADKRPRNDRPRSCSRQWYIDVEKDEVEGLKPDVQEGADEADVGVERANTIGSWKLSAKGRTRASPARSARRHGCRGNFGGVDETEAIAWDRPWRTNRKPMSRTWDMAPKEQNQSDI